MQLTPHFTLPEFTTSQTAVRNNIDNTPPQEAIDNLKRLCENVLEPLHKLLNVPIHISSGYRCFDLNKTIGGASNSQHLIGKAADITAKGYTAEELFEFIRKNLFGFDQVIQEFNSWVHISYDGMNNRNMDLLAVKENGKTKYLPA